ncbi:RNA uridylyltransferase [Malassezia cuniculi]|uniref:polynucleotide adenylyltransferase n=1 Tax=Malassezia cuniculi TaxID=948313 RepID=A0AAF0EXD9_9BASI|nr:RNA uridylyltransferase [Malassezia cuniculi]
MAHTVVSAAGQRMPMRRSVSSEPHRAPRESNGHSRAAPAHARNAVVPLERHTADLSQAMVAYLTPLLPTEEEYRIKEATRRQLERLTSQVSGGARLLAFGSMANGFALRNSDMDLCCLLDGDERSSAELVEDLGGVIRAKTDFNVLPLPTARIPIVKISRPPTKEVPYEISCDIGFDNLVALENTRLLLSYAMVDPPRVRSLVLFLKVWAKRRKINSPFTGTLSSYGYTLMALFFLIHVKRPAVLPNLQRVPSGRALSPDDVLLQGHNVYFCDDIEALRKEWASQNTESIGELLIDFFRYFSRDYNYQRDVISMRTACGLLTKEACGWQTEHLGVEDPFQVGYNVARTVTKDGLYTIRGELMRASRLLSNRSVRGPALIDELCAEREDGLTRAPDPPGKRGRAPWPVPKPSRAQGGVAGSFAFEEMAKSLANATGVPQPPTAMLAPLSQSRSVPPGALPGTRHPSGAYTPRRASGSCTPYSDYASSQHTYGSWGSPAEHGSYSYAKTTTLASPTPTDARRAGDDDGVDGDASDDCGTISQPHSPEAEPAVFGMSPVQPSGWAHS